MKRINLDKSIAELLKEHPETKEIFEENGLGKFMPNKAFLSTLTLASFMKMRELNEGIFVSLLEKRIEAEAAPFLYTKDLPVKHLFRDAYEAAMERHYNLRGERFVSFLPMGCGGGDPYEDIWQTQDINDLPDVICSIGFGSFYRSEFTARFLDEGYYESVQPLPVPEPFASAGIADPKRIYTVYAVSTYIILVDFKKLKDLPVPSKWGDLLNPVYRDNIIVGGHDDSINEVLLLNILKDYGDEGLEKLLPNIKDTWHASEMAKAAGSSMAKGAAIYVMPWFFAKSCPNTEHTAIIFPEDGALASPMYMLVKKSEKERLKPVIDFMTGDETAGIMSAAFYPSLHPNAKNNLPEGARLKWLGWDFIHGRDMKAFSDEVNSRFMEKFKKLKGGALGKFLSRVR